MTKKELLALGKKAMNFTDIPGIPIAEAGTKYHAFLYLLAEAMQPNRIVELGTYIGESSKYMAMACPTASVVTVDINPDAVRQIEQVEPILPNLKAFCDDANAFAAKYDRTPIDLLFLDVNHDFSLTHTAYENWQGFVREGGIICVDDIHLDGETEQFNHYLADKGVKVIDIPAIHATGFGCIIKEKIEKN